VDSYYFSYYTVYSLVLLLKVFQVGVW